MDANKKPQKNVQFSEEVPHLTPQEIRAQELANINSTTKAAEVFLSTIMCYFLSFRVDGLMVLL
jgi:hypothetical protein